MRVWAKRSKHKIVSSYYSQQYLFTKRCSKVNSWASRPTLETPFWAWSWLWGWDLKVYNMKLSPHTMHNNLNRSNLRNLGGIYKSDEQLSYMMLHECGHTPPPCSAEQIRVLRRPMGSYPKFFSELWIFFIPTDFVVIGPLILGQRPRRRWVTKH